MNSRAVDDERLHRFTIWGELQADSGTGAVAPATLQRLGLYKGQRGIWVNKARTADLTGDGVGMAVRMAHTGTVYDDDLSDEGMIYRYPRTGMPGRDKNEIEATKAASRLGIPIFVIASSPESSSLAQVRLGWVAEWDDLTEQFLVMFGDEPGQSNSQMRTNRSPPLRPSIGVSPSWPPAQARRGFASVCS